jgi:hypothetical protein
MTMGATHSREQIERAARMYKRVCDASKALGITSRSFSRLCRRYEIETPWTRKRRERASAKRHQA